MLLVVSGNDPVRLVEEMARRIGRHRSPFLMERILMASPLLGAFVQRQLTLDLGIFSAISILPPGRFLWDVLVETFPEAPRQNPLSQDRVALFLMEFFSGNGTDREQCLPEGIPLPGDPESRWNLSLTLSEIIDRMVIYRPDWIARWERESVSTDSWSRLWNLIRRGVPGHRVSLLEQFSICCENSPERLSGMSFVKTPVHVYGQSLLPPSFLDFLKSLSRITDVVIYQWQPTDQYFSLPSKGSGQPDPFQGSATHPLTRALGKQSGRIRDLLLARADETSESFVPPDGDSLLSRIRRGIVADHLDRPCPPLLPADSSVGLHFSRTPMGEVQALHKELLSSFSRDRSLCPGDVLVMASDIDLFAPFIEAVFGQRGETSPSIPYRLLGTRQQGTGAYLEAFFSVAKGKCSASEVMGLLDQPLSKERFDLDNDEIERLERWISRLPVWWGTEAMIRELYGDSETYLNTFSWGVDRLLLSFSLPTGSPPIGILAAYDAGDLWEVAPVLEKFQKFLQVLKDLQARLPPVQSFVAWGEALEWIVSHLFGEESLVETQPEIYEQLISLARWFAPPQEEEKLRLSGIDLPFTGFSRILADHLAMAGIDHRGVSGHSVTFSGMVAARGIPARFVALLGMSSDLFSLKDRNIPFDPLMSQQRSGDHSRREDDQEMFLEAILSARDRLFISYSGSGQEGPDEVVPASPVSHLMDVLTSMGVTMEKTVRRHPLTEGFVRIRPEGRGPGPRQEFFFEGWDEAIALALPPSVRFSDMRFFLRDPSSYFWSSWSGRPLKNAVSRLATSDPFVPDYLEEWMLGKSMFSKMELSGGQLPSKEDVASTGVLPHGKMGQTAYERVSALLVRLWKTKDLMTKGKTAVSNDLLESRIRMLPALLGLDFRIEGKLSGQVFIDEGTVSHMLFLPTRHSVKDRLCFWFEHLVLQLLFDGTDLVSTMVSWSQDGHESYRSRTDASRNLRDLFLLFSIGQKVPVPLFPKSAGAYAKEWRKAIEKGTRGKARNGDSLLGEPIDRLWDGCGIPRREKALEEARGLWRRDRKNPDIAPAEGILYANDPPWGMDLLSGGLSDAEKMAFLVMAPMELALLTKTDAVHE